MKRISVDYSSLHGVRDHWVRLSTRLVNTFRGYLAEFGIVAARGRMGVEAFLEVLADDEDDRIPDPAQMKLVRAKGGHAEPEFLTSKDNPSASEHL